MLYYCSIVIYSAELTYAENFGMISAKWIYNNIGCQKSITFAEYG